MKGILPKEILTRTKMGFPVPVGTWLRGPFAHVVDEYVLSPRAADRRIFNREFVTEIVARHRAGENHTERLWSLINFEIWQRRFIDGETTRRSNDAEVLLKSWPAARASKGAGSVSTTVDPAIAV
jgi:asparagine synthase (glutamine-hydrolysing)